MPTEPNAQEILSASSLFVLGNKIIEQETLTPEERLSENLGHISAKILYRTIMSI